MNATTPPDDAALTPAMVALLEQACDRFEAAWKAGARPALEDYLATMPAEGRLVLFRELMSIEAEYRRRGVPDLLAASARASDVLGPPGTPAAEIADEVSTNADAAIAFEAHTHASDPGATVDHGPGAPPGEPKTTAPLDDRGPGPSGKVLAPGTVMRYFGDYEIRRELGRGAMGIVYEARQISLNRPVALKMVKAGLLAGDDELRRFQNEAEAVALLDHPGIVPVYEVGRHDGQHYFSMKLVRGGSLVSLIDRYTRDPRAAAHLVAEAAEAVAHAHARGILHRDLKPANILVDAEGHPHVTDFGLAKRVEADVELTQSGAILGTPAYMSPEQATGHRGAVTTASDVYGLGAVLYALLTARAPFGGDSVVETLEAVRNAAPEPPTRLNRAVPRDLETICLKAMAKEPPRRFASAAELAADLKRWLAGEPITARPVGPLEKAWRWARRHPAAAGLLAATAVASLALVAAGFFMTYSRRLEKANQVAEEQRSRAQAAYQAESAARQAADEQRGLAVRAQGLEAAARKIADEKSALAVEAHGEAQRALALANRYLYFLRVNQAEAAWRGNLPERTAALLDECPSEQRDWEWHYLDQQCKAPLLEIKSRTATLGENVAYSPDGRRIATGDNATVKVWDAATGQALLTLRGHTGSVQCVAYNPDGRQIAAASLDQAVKVWDAATGNELFTLRGHTKSVHAVAYSPDGRHIAAGGHDGTVRVWDAATGRELNTLRGYSKLVYGVAYSPDGRRIVAAGGSGTVTVWDAATTRELLSLRVPNTLVYRAAFSPDGRRIASATSDKTLKVWDAATGKELFTLRGHTGAVFGVAYSPDGRRIASASADKTLKVWDAATGRELLTLRGHAEGLSCVAYSPDGRGIAAASRDGTVKMWDAVTGQEALALRGNLLFDQGLAYSPDGRHIAAAGRGSTLQVWDAATGEELLSIPEHPEIPKGLVPVVSGPNGSRTMSNGLAYSVDGRRIASGSSERTVTVWDAATGQELLTLRGHTKSVTCVAYSPDGRGIASASEDGTVKLWDAATGQETFTLRGHAGIVSGVAYSPDGHRIASSCRDRTLKVWDAASGQELFTLRGHTGPVQGVAYSPDGHRIVSASGDKTLKLWDAVTPRELFTLRGHTAVVQAVAYSPDGRRIASAGDDGTVKLWDAATGQEALTVLGVSSFVFGVAFSPDGRHIASVPGRTLLVCDGTPVTAAWKAERLALASQRALVWQRSEARDSERQKQWFAALWHLDWLVAQNPDDTDLQKRRDAARARLAEEETQNRGDELPADVFAK
jgi:WD40 repeat protein